MNFRKVFGKRGLGACIPWEFVAKICLKRRVTTFAAHRELAYDPTFFVKNFHCDESMYTENVECHAGVPVN